MKFISKKSLIIKASRIFRIEGLINELFRPRYHRSRKFIEIDITHKCNLRCINCDMSCRQAVGEDDFTVEQIEKFIKESIENNIAWEKIRLLGGEPTLHKDISHILTTLLNYKKKNGLHTRIQLVSNGCGEKVNNVLSTVPDGVEIENTSKISAVNTFHAFNKAPIDDLKYRYANFAKGCNVATNCGMGLTPYGYYPCIVAGGIDRVLGFDCGRKQLPGNDDSMIDLLKTFCKLCGHFGEPEYTEKEEISKSWGMAYEKYKDNKSNLSLY